MRREDIEKKTEELVIPILEKRSFELWDVEYVKEGPEMYLRVFIDKEGGIMIDDCVDVSHELSDLLDEYDYIDDEYILEVSSPGLGRTLKKDREYEKSIGRDVDIKLYKPVDGSKEFTGTLIAFDAENVTIKIDEEEKTFIRKETATVKLHIEF
ncbi:MAG: ribosome maturation factor RimP [Lachnospiraceae bacterium]|nr:ribosome maturation factor RimP [Lachnospiraceae bacterium]